MTSQPIIISIPTHSHQHIAGEEIWLLENSTTHSSKALLVRSPVVSEAMESVPSPQEDPKDAAFARLDLTEPSEEKSLLGVLALYPIFNTLCSHLDIGGLLTVRKISKKLDTHLSTHMKERWNINRRLARFVRDPRKLRSEMARHGALISGSFVIQFFDDVIFQGSDLDIYVEDGEAASAFHHYLRQVECYTLDTEKTEPVDYDLPDIIRVRDLHSIVKTLIPNTIRPKPTNERRKMEKRLKSKSCLPVVHQSRLFCVDSIPRLFSMLCLGTRRTPSFPMSLSKILAGLIHCSQSIAPTNLYLPNTKVAAGPSLIRSPKKTCTRSRSNVQGTLATPRLGR